MAVDKLVDSNQLDADLTSVANAIRAKGGTSDPLAFPNGFVSAVNSIPTGGGAPVERKDVNFIDYDGTIVASYTADEFAALAALPENPTHDGLTAQGWNWTLANAKAYVENHGKLFIGQMYITDDGKTRIYIHLERGRLAPRLGIAVSGSVMVDWGDGCDPETVTGSSTTTIIYTEHEYTDTGDYVITIDAAGAYINILGSGSFSALLTKNGQSSLSESTIYRRAIRKIELGNGASIGNYAFYGCSELASITIPESATSIGENAFSSCGLLSVVIPTRIGSIKKNAFDNCSILSSVAIPMSLTSIQKNAFSRCTLLNEIAIPDGVTSIGLSAFTSCGISSVKIPDGVTIVNDSTFSSCSSLISIYIPQSVTTIQTYAFSNCSGLAEIVFASTTPPTVSGSNAFTNLPVDCKIYVPVGSLSAYTSATNYPDPSTYTYIEE